MPYVQTIKTACRGFSFKVYPLSIHPSAYKLLRPPPAIPKLKTACNWLTPPVIGMLLKCFRFSRHAFLFAVLTPFGPGQRTNVEAPQLPSLSLLCLRFYSSQHK